MAVNKFIFRAYPDFLKRTVILIVAIALCVLLSYIVPGWDYLNTHLDLLEKHFGKNVPVSILLLFYLSLSFIVYMALFNRFSKTFYISTTNNGQFTIHTGDQNEILIKKEDFQFTGEKTFRIKNILNSTLRKHPKGISVKSFQQYINETGPQQVLGNSFSGSILPMAVVYTSLVAGFVIYIAYAIGLYKMLLPHMDALQILFRARSPLLMIMISLPFMAAFFLVMYYLYQWTVFRKHRIKIDWSESQVTVSAGKKKYVFKKNEVKTSVFFINRLTHLPKWLIVEQKKGTRYMIFNKDEDHQAFQDFIDSYVKYFDIDIEKATTTVGSSSSTLMKKKYTHE
ncbi:hypothetical protein OK18_12770 [Chryseobacterium gallinarum]|uniref:Uncharacterized protein n=1 Tax=Chryseobacterium gallinarum TaxID=1324352 RepID=A0A0G3M393_CHRGL|nr:hypothetical protein OK18_12770 [Chryseobacterium gallinarum]